MTVRKLCSTDDIRGLNIGLQSAGYMTALFGIGILPFYIYLFGAGMVWVLVGVAAATFLLWGNIPFRLKRYHQRHNKVYTIPGYMQVRFRCKDNYMRVFIASEIIILTSFLAAIFVKITGQIMHNCTGLNSTTCGILMLAIACFVLSFNGYVGIYKYTLLKVMVPLLAALVVTVYIILSLGFPRLVVNTMSTNIQGSVTQYLNIAYYRGGFLRVEDVITLVSNGFILAGLPFLYTICLKSVRGKQILSGRKYAVVFMLLMGLVSSFLGGVSRGFLFQKDTAVSFSEYVGDMFNVLFGQEELIGVVVGLIYFLGVLAACYVIIECCVYNIATILCVDLFKSGAALRGRYNRATHGIYLSIFITGFLITMLMLILPKEVTLNLMMQFVALLGCSVGTVVYLSLKWRRLTRQGAMAGVITGLVAIPIYRYVGIFGSEGIKYSLSEWLGVSPVSLALATTVFMIFFVSLITPPESQEVSQELYEIKSRIS